MASEQHAVVVGGTSGIGEATAALFAARGYRVTIGGRSSERLAAAVARTKARGLVVDGGDAASVRAFFDEAGAFDHLVVALGGGKGYGDFRTLNLADVRDGFAAKTVAHLTVLQGALSRLAPSGSVTFIAAISARAALPGTAGLAAINGAIESMARPLAVELAPLRVNVVSPGVVDTPWWDAMPADQKAAYFEGAAQALPVKSVGKPSDVAAAVLMVAENPFITGSTIDVDGGLHLAR